MFEDIEDEFELDMIHQKDSDDEEEKKSKTRRRLSKKMNFTQVKQTKTNFEIFRNFFYINKNYYQYLAKMREEAETERLKQIEEEEKQNRLRRRSSPALRQTQAITGVERSTFSEPIPRRNEFVSLIFKV